MEKARVYLDWAAATPLLPAAKAAMLPYLESEYGNPGAVHQEGVAARTAVEHARAAIGHALQIRPAFITFTAGGTEGNNLAISGTIEALRAAGRSYQDMSIVTTRLEHPSVLAVVSALEKRGVKVRYAPVDETGSMLLPEFKKLVDETTVLVSVAYANSEIGVIQPLHQLRKILQATEKIFGTTIFLHVDGAQAPLWLPCQFTTVGADLLVLDAAKYQGPKGVGVLLRSRRAEVTAVQFGGGQENGLRPGTENVPNVVGSSVALVAAQEDWQSRAERIAAVRDQVLAYVQSELPDAIINGPLDERRIANNVNISLPGLDTEFATVVLDANGYAVSTKSACAGTGGGESSVVKEISGDAKRASATLRLTLGPDTTFSALKDLVDILRQHCNQMKTLTE